MSQDAVTQELWKAVWSGSLAGVREALSRGAQANRRDPKTLLTPLMAAAGIGCAAIVEDLIAAGADVNSLDGRAGATALHKACQGGHADVAQKLLDQGAFVNVQATSTGHTPLFEAAWFLSVETVQLLLDHGARVDRKLLTYYGFSFDDHIAYEKKVNTGQESQEKLALIEELVKRKREVDQELGENSLLVAVRSANIQAVRDALAQGINTETRYPVVGEFDDGHTALLIASRNGAEDIVEILVAAGADVNAVEPVFGAVPLHKATYNGYLNITRILATAPKVNLNYQGPSNGYTPLLDALWHGFADCAEVLMDAGAATDVIGYDGKLALDLAREELGPDHPLTTKLEGLETGK